MYKIANLLLSLPIIFVTLCFMPALGIILLIVRMYLCPYYKNYKFNISIAICGLLLYVPKLLSQLKLDIPYLNNILNNDIYIEVSKRGKFIIGAGVVFFLITYVSRMVRTNLRNTLMAAAAVQIRKEAKAELSLKKEDEEVEEIKKFKKITEYHCPYCGGLTKSTKGVEKCKYCDREVTFEEK